MRLVDDLLVLAPTDLSTFLSCRHRTGLDLAAARHVLKKPTYEDPYAAMLAERGEAHEQQYVESLRAQGLDVVHIPRGEGRPTAESLARHTAETLAAMQAGAEVIVQARLAHADLAGYADILLRVDRAERAGRVVLRSAGHQARARNQGRHHPAAVRVFGPVGPHAGPRAGALSCGHARSGAAAPHLPRRRLSRLLPHGAFGARRRNRAGARAAPDDALSGAGGALRRVRVAGALLRSTP